MLEKEGNMKLKKTKLIAVCLASAMILSCLTPMGNAVARQETKTISDSFDASDKVGSYDTEMWSVYGSGDTIKVEEIVKPKRALWGGAKNVTGETNLLMTKDWYWEIHSFSFDMYMPLGTSWENSQWAFLDFVDIDEPVQYAGDYSEQYGEPMCYDAMKVLGEDDFGLMHTKWTDWGFGSETIGDVWLSVKVVTENASTGKIMIAPKGQAFNEEKAQSITLAGNKSFYNSNIVLGDFKFAGYLFDNFVIETDTGTYKEDFEDGTNDLFEEVAIREMDKSSYIVAEYDKSRQLSFKNATAEDRIMANQKITKEDKHLKDTDKVLDVSFIVDYKSNNTSEEIAYVFGLSSNDASPFFDNCAFVIGKNRVRLSYFDADGVETTYASKKLGSSLTGNTVSLTLTKEGIFTASVDGTQVLKHSGIERYDGYAGFVAKTDISKAIYLDDVVMKNTIFEVITTKSWKDDFSENRMGSGTDTDYAWYVEGGSMLIENGELAFKGCSDNTYVGPAYQYETYEISFQMTSLLVTDDEEKKREGTYYDRWIGFDFGKTASTIKTYGTYGLLAVRVTPPQGGKEWTEADSFVHTKDSSPLAEVLITKAKSIPASYFEDISYDGVKKFREEISPDDAVCFKLVALENRLELYMKRVSDKEYTLYTTVEDVDPKGYVALACTGFAHWTIDNFEIKNTAEIYNEAAPIVIEEKVFPTLAERGVGVEDTYWAREQKLNVREKTTSPVGWIAGVSGVALVGVGAFIVFQVQRKKKTKKVEDN